MLDRAILRLLEDEDGWPLCCTLCGRPSADYLITPWPGVNVGQCCVQRFIDYGAQITRYRAERPDQLRWASQVVDLRARPHSSEP